MDTNGEMDEARQSNEATLTAISDNAVSLLEDAELLFEQGRYARASAIAILCIEEVGKFFLVKWQEREWQRSIRHHHKKHSVIATFDQAKVAAQAALASTDDLMEVFMAYCKYDSHEAWENTEAGNRLLQRMADAAKAASAEPITLLAMTGGLAALKNRALYVDVDETGIVQSSPSQIDKACAEACLGYARSAVSQLDKHELVVAKMSHAIRRSDDV